MKSFRRRHNDWCQAYSKSELEANQYIGELMESNKNSLKVLNQIKKDPEYNKASHTVKRQLKKYIKLLKQKGEK